MRRGNKKKFRKFSFKEQYAQSWKYIRESKKFIYLAMGIFFFFVLFGYFIPAPKSLYDIIMPFIRQLIEQTQGMSQSQLIQFIIENNVKSTFIGILSGIVLGVFPIIETIANGYMLGFVSLLSVKAGGFLTLWKLFPHGIFELPAVFISLGLGIKMGTFIFQKKKIKSFVDYSIKSLKVFLLIIIPLLIIAGIIEGTLMVLIK
ncbi:Stage II sporulation protein M [uncultured archaeon]|nr:Stage II sporulation protein M [uncultured archaeon]